VHDSRVEKVILLERGRNLLSYGTDGKVVLWETGSASAVRIFKPGIDLKSVVVTKLNEKNEEEGLFFEWKHELAIFLETGFVLTYDIASGKLISEIRSEYRDVASAIIIKGVNVFGTATGSINDKKFSNSSIEMLETCDNCLIAQTRDNTISVLDSDLNIISFLTGNDTHSLNSVFISKKQLYVLSSDGYLRVYCMKFTENI